MMLQSWAGLARAVAARPDPAFIPVLLQQVQVCGSIRSPAHGLPSLVDCRVIRAAWYPSASDNPPPPPPPPHPLSPPPSPPPLLSFSFLFSFSLSVSVSVSVSLSLSLFPLFPLSVFPFLSLPVVLLASHVHLYLLGFLSPLLFYNKCQNVFGLKAL